MKFKGRLWKKRTLNVLQLIGTVRPEPDREGFMLKMVVVLFLANSIVGCATHVAASNRGGSVTESVHVKF
jgi:hypothetical protein